MPKLLEDISQIVREMDNLKDQANGLEIPNILRKMEIAAREVGNSWSKSWLGYQANVYYEYFRPPAKNAFFNRNHGITYRGHQRYATTGEWEEYEPDRVTNEIHKRAGDPDMKPVLDFRNHATSRVEWNRRRLLSVIDAGLTGSHSDFLLQLQEELNLLKVHTETELLEERKPEPPYQTDDPRAIQQGLKAPPHFWVISRVDSIQSVLKAIQFIGEIGRHLELHFSQQLPVPPLRPVGSNVFIGHGRSYAWRELKDFMEDQLGLHVDEFNSIQVAGTSITDRLMEMLRSATIAFLVMTGEDQQPTGELRPRENVVHEAGLFQGHLGFQRAIVLLEEGCAKFSNNAGLIHINFPKNNIRAAFQDVREVLDREGVLNKGVSP